MEILDNLKLAQEVIGLVNKIAEGLNAATEGLNQRKTLSRQENHIVEPINSQTKAHHLITSAKLNYSAKTCSYQGSTHRLGKPSRFGFFKRSKNEAYEIANKELHQLEQERRINYGASYGNN